MDTHIYHSNKLHLFMFSDKKGLEISGPNKLFYKIADNVTTAQIFLSDKQLFG